MSFMILVTVHYFFQALYWIIIIRVLLTWFPNIDWENPVFKTMRNIADPIMEPMRRLIPPISGLDLSPIVTLMLLIFVEKFVLQLLSVFLM